MREKLVETVLGAIIKNKHEGNAGLLPVDIADALIPVIAPMMVKGLPEKSTECAIKALKEHIHPTGGIHFVSEDDRVALRELKSLKNQFKGK